MQKCAFALFKAILLKMGKRKSNLTCVYEFAFLSMWLKVSWFLITPEKSDVAAPWSSVWVRVLLLKIQSDSVATLNEYLSKSIFLEVGHCSDVFQLV